MCLCIFVGRYLVYSNEAKDSSSMIHCCLLNESTSKIEMTLLNSDHLLRTNLKPSRGDYVLLITEPLEIVNIKKKHDNLIGIIVQSNSEAKRTLKNYQYTPVWEVSGKNYSGIKTVAEKRGNVSFYCRLEDGKYI